MAKFIGIIYKEHRKLAKFQDDVSEFSLHEDALKLRIQIMEQTDTDTSEEHKALKALRQG